MNQFEADDRSATYRERLTTDFTKTLRSRFGSAVEPHVIETLVDSAMGAVDALLDELTTEEVPDPPFSVPDTKRAMDPTWATDAAPGRGKW
jgi:hypothetical protein